MKKKEPVSTIMTKTIHAVQVKDNITNALEIVRKHSVRHVPVLKGKQLVGIISKTDINRLSFSGMFEGEEDADEAVFDMLTIAQVMTAKPRVVKASDTIYHVAEILSNEEFHALPVVDDNDDSKLVGIVTTTDVIRYMLEQY